MEELTIQKAVSKFLQGYERNLQLDFFRENGEVLFQVFKGKDVKQWNVEFTPTDNDVIVQIIFHPDKMNNIENLKRFFSGDFFKFFEKHEFYNQNAYFSVFNGSKLSEAYFQQVLEEIFEISFNEIYFTLNSY